MKIEKSDDYTIRAACVTQLLARGFTRASIRHEITLDTSSSGGRADIVVLADAGIAGIEIKSGRDTLDRCETQARQYKRAFDRLLLVADRRHVPLGDYNARPKHWGAVACYDAGALTDIHAHINPIWPINAMGASDDTSPFGMLSLLWANEACVAVASCGVLTKTRCIAIPRGAEHMSLKEIRAQVVKLLRARHLNRWEEAFWRKFDAATPVLGIAA